MPSIVSLLIMADGSMQVLLQIIIDTRHEIKTHGVRCTMLYERVLRARGVVQNNPDHGRTGVQREMTAF